MNIYNAYNINIINDTFYKIINHLYNYNISLLGEND